MGRKAMVGTNGRGSPATKNELSLFHSLVVVCFSFFSCAPEKTKKNENRNDGACCVMCCAKLGLSTQQQQQQSPPLSHTHSSIASCSHCTGAVYLPACLPDSDADAATARPAMCQRCMCISEQN